LPEVGRKRGGRHPLGLVGRDTRQPSQVNRVPLHRADIEKFVAQVVRNLIDDLRFAYTACAQICRGTRSPISAWSAS
jgi:hypothetical protein